MGWASFWAIFSQSSLVSLLPAKTGQLSSSANFKANANTVVVPVCIDYGCRFSMPFLFKGGPYSNFFPLQILMHSCSHELRKFRGGVRVRVARWFVFKPKIPNLGKFWRALEWYMLVCIFYDHLEYFMAIWYNLWPFGIVCGDLLYFSQFGMLGPRKIWQPW
jgi:hypothetical protein